MAINPFEILELLANWPSAASKDHETRARTRHRGLLAIWTLASLALLFGFYVYHRAPEVMSDRNGAFMFFVGAVWIGLTIALAMRRLRRT